MSLRTANAKVQQLEHQLQSTVSTFDYNIINWPILRQNDRLHKLNKNYRQK